KVLLVHVLIVVIVILDALAGEVDDGARNDRLAERLADIKVRDEQLANLIVSLLEAHCVRRGQSKTLDFDVDKTVEHHSPVGGSKKLKKESTFISFSTFFTTLSALCFNFFVTIFIVRFFSGDFQSISQPTARSM